MTNQHTEASVDDERGSAGLRAEDAVLSNADHRRAVLKAPVVLRVRDLEKSFQGLHAVDAVSFDLHEGEIVSIIGPNGSGKSTTINLISGFIAPDSGIIDIDNEPVAGLSAAEVADKGLARTFQNGRVFAGLTVDENIGLGYHKKLQSQRPLKGLQRFPIVRWLSLLAEAGIALVPGPGARRESREVDERIGREIDRFRERLESRRYDLAYTLSYANRRRTEIARAHISEPKLLLLDEPTAGMNQSETAEVLQQLQHLKAQGHTILLVEHKIDLVTALSDRVLAMDGGHIIAQGDPDEVRKNPQVVEAYLGKRRGTAKKKAIDERGVLNIQNALPVVSVDERRSGAEDDGQTVSTSSASTGGRVQQVSAEAGTSASASAAGVAGAAGGAGENGGSPLLALNDVDVFYGQVHALQHISIEVPQGAIVSLLGGNASGKSTTMKTILGLKHPKNGAILYDGKDITSASTRHRVIAGIAAVPEARRVFPQMTVQENLLAGAYTRKQSAERSEDVAEMFERFPRLKERRNQQAGTMSGGEQQMLAFARALMSHPRLICMDEPTMGLSPRLVEDVLDQIAKLRDELGVSVLMVEQQAELALSIADYGYVLQNGSIRLQGEASSLLNNPQVQEAYLGGAREEE